MSKWHDGWAEWNPESRWGNEGPTGDLACALDDADLRQIATIDRYFVSYHGVKWEPGDGDGGTELEMFVLGQFRDGTWFTVDAWNDYTGWGCQDGVDFTKHATREEAVRDGLTLEARRALDLLLPGDPR